MQGGVKLQVLSTTAKKRKVIRESEGRRTVIRKQCSEILREQFAFRSVGPEDLAQRVVQVVFAEGSIRPFGFPGKRQTVNARGETLSEYRKEKKGRAREWDDVRIDELNASLGELGFALRVAVLGDVLGKLLPYGVLNLDRELRLDLFLDLRA